MSLLMVCMSGRSVPAMAMVTSSVESRYRGGFMSINSTVQQFSMGLAAFIGGHILGTAPDGKITHFALGGLLSAVCVLICIYLARFLKKAPETKSGRAEPVMMEVG
jgi:MFS transporter, DHA1 family, inner membrane transport protein